jgi:hypothetical protein
MPRNCSKAFPACLKGIADFEFGECSKRHPERSGANAADFFSKNPSAWEAFFNSGRVNLTGDEARLFKNTIERANIKLAGIRGVYWAFAKFRSGEWKAQTKLEASELTKSAATIFNLCAAPSRVNQKTWDKYSTWIQDGATEEGSWAHAEEVADSVRYMWTLKTSKKQRTLRAKMKTLLPSAFTTNFQDIKTSTDTTSVLPEYLTPKYFCPDTHKREYTTIVAKVKKKEAVSRTDAMAIAVLPYSVLPRKGGRLVVFTYRGGLLLYDAIEKKGALLTQKDYDRLVQMLQSDAKLKMYYSKYDEFQAETSALMSTKYEAIMAMVTTKMKNTSASDANRLCRVFDVCQYLFLARLASDITDEAVECQIKKLHDEKLVDIIDVDAYMAIIDDEALGVKESLELAKFAKIFPCPDFCIYSVVDGVEAKAAKAHVASEYVKLSVKGGKTATLSDAEFGLYSMRNRALTFLEVHGFLPGKLITTNATLIPTHLLAYPNVNANTLTPSDMAFVDLTGSFNYRHYAGCEIELIKDKVIAPTIKMSDADTKDPSEYSKIEKNQVLKYLFDKNFLNQEEVSKLAVSGELFENYKQYILLALKPEAKKPGSRPFSMATDEVRRLLSEAEANVATYVTRQPGSSQGKSTMDLDSRMSTLAATPEFVVGYETYMMSFDLEGFSPMQSTRFKERAMKSWSTCFATPEFDATIRIFNDTTLLFDKFGLADTFKMVGNDLEGFHGRLNTAAHIDLMGYAVYKLKELGLTEGAAGLEVLIDDGLLRINIKRDKDHMHLKEAVRVIDAVYKFAGQNISWDKTFVSQVMCQYLNRIYYDGIEVTPGAKAFLRIGKNQECAVPTLADDLMAHAATTRGAIQSGTHHMMAYFAYCIEIYKTLKRWGLKHVDKESMDRIAFALHVPIGLGGLGISTLFGLSTNESLSSLQSGVAAMKMIVAQFPGYRQFANSFLNADIRPMSTEGILRNPMAMRTANRCLNVRRFANVAKAFILRNSTNALIKEANRGTFDESDEAIINTIAADTNISELKRKHLWDMTIASYLDTVVGKLQSSSTAAALIGAKRALAIYIANRGEAKMLINELALGILTVRFR